MRLPSNLDDTPYLPASYQLTEHARKRMSHRGISVDALYAAVYFGRIAPTRDAAEVFVIGRKEVARAQHQGIDLSRYEGVQVVCSVHGHVLTIFRNQRLKKDRRGRRH